MKTRPMHLITTFRLYGIAIDLTTANLSQLQLILAIPIELIPHTAPFPGSFFSLFNPCRRSGCRQLYLRFWRVLGLRYEGRDEIERSVETFRGAQRQSNSSTSLRLAHR